MTPRGESRKQRQIRARELLLRGDRQQQRGNLASGFRLLLMSAKLGDPSAQLNLGYTYDVGIGVRRNRAAAMHWYRRAYRSGVGIAASNLGTIFRDEGSYEEAARWFRRGVKGGDVDANLELAKIYLRDARQKRKAIACLRAILKGTPPINLGEDTQREARRMLHKIETGAQGAEPSRSVRRGARPQGQRVRERRG